MWNQPSQALIVPDTAATRISTNGTIVVEAAGLAIVENMARNGHPITSIAATLGMSTRVLRECRKRQPEVEEAYAAGLAGLEHELVHNLLTAARKGNIVAALFLLKTRHGYRETGQKDNTPTVAVQINLPGALDERAYARTLAKEATDGDDA